MKTDDVNTELRIVDRMTSDNGASGRLHDDCSTGDDLFEQSERKRFTGPADQLQSGYGHASHGIDVGKGVGRGDAPPVVRVIDDWGEEVDRLDESRTSGSDVYGRIVAGLEADQEIGMAGDR